MKKSGKNLKEINTEKKVAGVIFVIFLAFLIYAFNFLIPPFIDREIADLYCRNVFEWIALPGNIITGLFIGSVTELCVVVGSLIGIFLIFFGIFRTFMFFIGKGSPRFLRRAYKCLVILMAAAVYMSASFQLMHGMNYKRTPAYATMGLRLDDPTAEDFDTYLAALNWAYRGMVSNREKIGEDFAGVAHIMSSYEECVTDANLLLDSFSYTYDLAMSKTYIRAKAVSMSSLWSSTHIVGVYDPFIGESNINTDYLDILDFPRTLLHEISHAKGYARESDANLIAALALIHSQRPDFKYAGYYYIFNNLYGVVSEYAAAEGRTLPDYFSDKACEGVLRDIRASYCYWDYIDSRFMAETVEDISEEVNNSFLEANGQEGGTETYHVSPNAFVEFYVTYVEGPLDD